MGLAGRRKAGAISCRALPQTYHVIAVDLPGQGFSRAGSRHRLSLTRMSEDLAALAAHEGWHLDLIVGHSAGAALALDLACRIDPKGVVGLNAALGKFEGVAGWLFPLMAKVLALNPFASSILTRMPNSEARVRELLETTGSRFDDRTLALYRRLAADRDHVSGTIAMMAQWNIDALLARLDRVPCPVLLLAGAQDGTVPPETSQRAAQRMDAGQGEGASCPRSPDARGGAGPRRRRDRGLRAVGRPSDRGTKIPARRDLRRFRNKKGPPRRTAPIRSVARPQFVAGASDAR